MDEQIQRLREVVAKMLQLLNDPHPGCITWIEAVQNKREEINKIMDQ